MKNLILTILLAVNLLPALSQTPTFVAPDYDAIKKEIQVVSSKFYYPRLMERFQALDTSLKADEYKHLIYGYVFQKEYKPYQTIPEEREFRAYVSRLNTLTTDELDKMIELGNRYRILFPFNSDVAKYLWMAYQQKNDFSTGLKLSMQSFYILNTIKSSGDGLSRETAYHVLTIGNEYELLRSLFLQRESQSLIERKYDYLKLKQNRSNIEGLYFNIEQMMASER
jgi:hypothetical protein